LGAIVFFAFILFVMGGVTAYMGDRLGSYIGKKRHSTFGLRPRHTAMLWTVVSGGVIAVGTLLLFVALNNTFKTAARSFSRRTAISRAGTGRCFGATPRKHGRQTSMKSWPVMLRQKPLRLKKRWRRWPASSQARKRF